MDPDRAVDVPQNVILFIGDGLSLSQWTAARFASQPLAVERMAEIGLIDTRPHEPSSGLVTESSSAATAYSTGVRTYNGAIGVGPDSQVLQTVLERAEELGMATGLVATSSVTDATPAAFASHVPDQTLYLEIARQMASIDLEVLMGGGRAWFDGSQPDSVNLLERMNERYTVVEDAAALDAQAADATALLGLFTRGGMPPAGARSPTLAAMTGAALKVLAKDRDGFFIMVEGSQIDWRGHHNAPLDELVAEVLDFDRAIAVALDFRERHPETLVLVVGDHETGGLALHPAEGGGPTVSLQANYTTSGTAYGHTAQMVPLFADGPGAERFGGILDNAEVGRRLRALIER
jgi:alkaline phosphatase